MKPGLYEQVINRLLDIRLGDKKYKVETPTCQDSCRLK